MPKPCPLWFLPLCLPLFLPGPEARAAEPTGRPAAADTHGDAAAEPPTEVELEERSSSRDGRVVIAGQAVEYTATVGDIVLRDDEGKPRAKMTYVSYLRQGVPDRAARPVTFAFNGGPGSASVWVHLGAFGPKRAELDAEGFPVGPPPGRLIDNPYSLLDATDLVFIDPVETGWSRPAPGVETKEFTGFTKDVESVGDFIRLWVSRNGRWASPKLIAGESYGTTRAAGLARYLQDRHGMFLNGICLISSVVNWGTKVFNVGNDLAYVLILPTYTATAWYHGKLPDRFDGDLRAALAEAEELALGDYASALMRGDLLPAEERRRLAARLAELTGLSQEYLEDADLRVEIFRFTKELLRDEGLTVGRLDSRYTGRDRDDAGETFEYDPASALTTGWYVSLMKDYLRRELGYDSDLEFRHSAGRKVRPWDYHESDPELSYGTNAYANYAEHLRRAMHENPYLQVLVMSGYYDLATPYFASDYTATHMQLDESVRDHLRVAYYEAGHMMYVREASLAKLREDYLRLLRDALAAAPTGGAARAGAAGAAGAGAGD
ncbi:MAG TPA: peptidase S10 [Thermoanaerobaculia bacterium]|nr:peptidase S10 [Thermoanaerobaculia bacterium]